MEMSELEEDEILQVRRYITRIPTNGTRHMSVCFAVFGYMSGSWGAAKILTIFIEIFESLYFSQES